MKPKHLIFFSLLSLAACVPQRKFDELQNSYNDQFKKNADCQKTNLDLQEKTDHDTKTINDQQTKIESLNRDTALQGTSLRKLTDLNSEINTAYQKLLDKQREIESGNKLKTEEISSQLEETQHKLNEKEVELTNKEDSLNKINTQLITTRQSLDSREKKVKELSDILNKKDSTVKALRNTISDALLGFKDKGLTVSLKDGKVYVSVQDKLLFQSGKYAVNNDGKDALIQLSNALLKMPDVSIMVEGHTDSIPYKGNGTLVDNLDLSAKRATEVARILTSEGKIAPAKVIAAGRGDTEPVASNSTPEGRAQNRRTEIILTPNLGELYKVLNQN